MTRLLIIGTTLALLASPALAQDTTTPKRATASAMPASLEAAYRKEFAFLEAEKQALQRRLAGLRSEHKSRVAKARAKVDSLQNRLISEREAVEKVEELLHKKDVSADGDDEQFDRLADAMSRARATLKTANFELSPAPAVDENGVIASEDRIKEITEVFAAANQLLTRAGEIRTEPGTFFLSNGAMVDGTLLRLGAVATYGLSDGVSGALAPAGAGRLKLWNAPSEEAAKALAKDPASIAQLPVFLYESLDKAIDQKPEKTVLSIIESGGVVAWVIVVLGCIAMLMALIRFILLTLAGQRGRVSLEDVLSDVTAGRLSDAQGRVASPTRPLGRVVRATLSALGREREDQESVVTESILREAPGIERFGTAMTVVAAVAPLLGLLGTVTGMIATFDVITEHGTGDPKLLSGGISEALITTELGLVVAIPTLILGALLSAKAEGLLGRLESAALAVMNRHVLSQGEGPITPPEDPPTASSSELVSETADPRMATVPGSA